MSLTVYRLIRRVDARKIAAVKALREIHSWPLKTAKNVVDGLDGKFRPYRTTLIRLSDSEYIKLLPYFEMKEVEIPEDGFYYIPPGTNYTRYGAGSEPETKATVLPVFFESIETEHAPNLNQYRFKVFVPNSDWREPDLNIIIVRDSDVIRIFEKGTTQKI